MRGEAECGHSLFAWEHTLAIPKRALKMVGVRFTGEGSEVTGKKE